MELGEKQITATNKLKDIWSLVNRFVKTFSKPGEPVTTEEYTDILLYLKQYITEANEQAIKTATHLEETRKLLEQGEIISVVCIQSCDTPTLHNLLQDYYDYLYSLIQHRNTLHYALSCIYIGDYASAKVSTN